MKNKTQIGAINAEREKTRKEKKEKLRQNTLNRLIIEQQLAEKQIMRLQKLAGKTSDKIMS